MDYTFCFRRFNTLENGGTLKDIVKKVKVRGYNKTHEFAIERISLGGHNFIHLTKNNNIILNCTEKEFVKMKNLFCDLRSS